MIHAGNLNEQIELIKQKIRYDSLFIEKDTFWTNRNLIDKLHVNTEGFVEPAMVCVYYSTMVQDNEGNSCCNKIVFILSAKKIFCNIDLNEDPDLSWISNEISVTNTLKIELLDSRTSQAFGSNATEGVVLIILKDKKFIKKIKKYFKQKRKAVSD